jgi:hypothetical protein
MKAISVRQPWAWLIASGHKRVENRTWSTRYRGPVLIHASKSPVSEDDAEVIRVVAGELGIHIPSDLPIGGIIGQAEIVDCVDDSNDDWFEGPFGFIMANAQSIPFVPAAGGLGLFDISL